MDDNSLNCTHTTIPMYIRYNGCRTIGLSDYRAVGLPGCRTIGSSEYKAVTHLRYPLLVFADLLSTAYLWCK